jgi:hypothetical protein
MLERIRNLRIKYFANLDSTRRFIVSNRFLFLNFRQISRGDIGKFWLILWLLGQFFGIITLYIFLSPSLAVDNLPISSGTASVNLLELTDLPAGFEVAPPLLQQIIKQAIEQTQTGLKKANIDLEKTIIFVDIGTAEIVICVTMKLANLQARETFDRQLQKTDSKEVFLLGFRQVLRFLGEAKVEEAKVIEPLAGLGESSLGYRLAASIANFSTQIFADSLAFRRREMGILLIVGSLDSPPERVDIRELAFKLDRRLQNSSYDQSLQIFMTQKRHSD